MGLGTGQRRALRLARFSGAGRKGVVFMGGREKVPFSQLAEQTDM